jgi:hypothetical protein
MVPPTCMSSRTPPSPLSLQAAANNQPFSKSPRPVKGEESSNKVQGQRRPQIRLWKKASPETQTAPRYHHESSVKKNTGDRLELRKSSSTTSLR